MSEGNIPLQILNTGYFFGRCSELQLQQRTLQHTAFLLYYALRWKEMSFATTSN